MAAKNTATNGYAQAILALIFQNVVTDTAAAAISTGLVATGTAGSLYVSLHTASPGATGSQTTSEATYGSYARQAVARSAVGWTVTANSVSPAANITFPTSTGTPSETEAYFGVGTASTGAGNLLYFGPISPTIGMTAAGIQPILTTATAITEV